MAGKIVEFFGFAPRDPSATAVAARDAKTCPFVGGTCVKTLSDGEISGACSIRASGDRTVVCCPVRLYADDYAVLHHVAELAFGSDIALRSGPAALTAPIPDGKSIIAVFGKKRGGELRLPSRARTGGYYVDWVLAKLTANGELEEFVAVEVQSIDTTGNYRAERESYLAGQGFDGRTTAGLNWENVNKRILPQLIYKGQVLEREHQCRKGMFFICPTPVLLKIFERLGGPLPEYPMGNGSITLVGYDLGEVQAPGVSRSLEKTRQLTTTIGQLSAAFNTMRDLPEPNVYAAAIRLSLNR